MQENGEMREPVKSSLRDDGGSMIRIMFVLAMTADEGNHVGFQEGRCPMAQDHAERHQDSCPDERPLNVLDRSYPCAHGIAPGVVSCV